MITERKYRILLWAVIVLAVTNLTTIGTLVWMRYRPDLPRDERPMYNQNTPRGGWFMNALELNDEQQASFQHHSRQFRENARQLAEEMNTLRQQMMQEMVAPTPDTIQLNKLSEQIGHNHAKLKQMTWKYFNNLRSCCPPDQLPTLENEFHRFMKHEGEGGRHGKNRRQHNRQPQNQ